MKAPDVKVIFAPQGASRAPKTQATTGAWSMPRPPGRGMLMDAQNRTLRNAVSSVSQFPRQGWSALKFSLKSKILNENGKLVEGGGGRMATT